MTPKFELGQTVELIANDNSPKMVISEIIVNPIQNDTKYLPDNNLNLVMDTSKRSSLAKAEFIYKCNWFDNNQKYSEAEIAETALKGVVIIE